MTIKSNNKTVTHSHARLLPLSTVSDVTVPVSHTVISLHANDQLIRPFSVAGCLGWGMQSASPSRRGL